MLFRSTECRCYQAEAPESERNRTVPFTFGLKQVTETAAWIEFAAAPGPGLVTAAEVLTIRDACRALGIRECLILPRRQTFLIDILLRTLPFRPIDRLITFTGVRSNRKIGRERTSARSNTVPALRIAEPNRVVFTRSTGHFRQSGA